MLSIRNKIILLVAGILIMIAILIDGFLIEPNQLEIKKVEITLPGLSTDTNIRLAVISDLHIGLGNTDLKRIRKIVRAVNNQSPEIIVNLGDYHSHTIGTSNIPIESISKELKKLKAKYGVYSILGNHDGLIIQHKWLDGRFKTLAYQKQMIIDLLKMADITPLDNSLIVINIKSSKIILLGLTDKYSTTHNYIKNILLDKVKPAKYPNLKKLIKTIPDKIPVILLNHSPDIFPAVPERIALTLSGHTHNGHANIPIFKDLINPSIYGAKYIYGLIKEKNKILYVTNGTGGFPLRLNNPPQVVIIQLKGKE